MNNKTVAEIGSGLLVGSLVNLFASKKLTDKNPSDTLAIKLIMAIEGGSMVQLIVNKIYD